jgi:phosphoribosylaminoimidazole-succinocarboxamide synthase
MADGYEHKQEAGEPQKQLSKEFVREWLMANGFQGRDGQKIPLMSDEIVNSISNRYIELFEQMTGEVFIRTQEEDVLQRIENNIIGSLQSLNVTQE